MTATPDFNAAQQAFQTFVDRLPKTASVVAMHDSDADGITAGVIWQRASERAGFEHMTRVIPDRERNAWTTANRERIAAAKPEFLFVMDLGSQAEPVLVGVPTCFIDHHCPGGVPTGATLISAYTWDPIPNTSWLVWQLCQQIADVSDLDWMAAIGILSDLGDRAPLELLTQAKHKYTCQIGSTSQPDRIPSMFWNFCGLSRSGKGKVTTATDMIRRRAAVYPLIAGSNC